MKALLLIDADKSAALSALSAAKKISDVVDVANVEGLLAEQIAPAIAVIASDYTHIITAATSAGKDFMPRIAATIAAPQVSEVIEVVDARTFKRPIYAGNAIETVQITAPTICATIRQSAFNKAESLPNINISLNKTSTTTRVVSLESTPNIRPELGSARIIVSGGRGVGSKENFKLLEKLADKLGAAIGASRAAVDAGYVPNDYQIGQTGKIVAPELYFAIGISGAIQHVAGMKDSKIIVAINKDENAPIFEVADYGLVGDLFTIVSELEQLL